MIPNMNKIDGIREGQVWIANLSFWKQMPSFQVGGTVTLGH